MDAVRLTDLFDRYVDATLSLGDKDELERALLDSSEARALFWQQVPLHGLIRECYETRSGQRFVASGSPPLAVLGDVWRGAVGFFSDGFPLAYLLATLIVGTAIGILSLIPVQHHVELAQQASPASVANRDYASVEQPAPVARVTGMVDVKWGAGGWGLGTGVQGSGLPSPSGGGAGGEGSQSRNPQIPKSPVRLGDTFALSSGLLQLTYDTGAKVILQGPCTYEVDSAAGGFLSVGKLTARVESEEWPVESAKPQAAAIHHSSLSIHHSSSLSPFPPPPSPFVVKTPTATVTDLGTEFGVEVSQQGLTTSHVFRGTVEVQLAARDGQQGQVLRLSENESAQVEKQPGGQGLAMRRVVSDPADFVRLEQFPKLANEASLKQIRKPFERWQAYSQELRRDPSLLAYYDFQLRDGHPALLANVAKGTEGSCDGVVENATWSDGRMSGKHALLFNGPRNYVRVNLPQKTDDLTLAIWIRFDLLDQSQLSSALLMSEGWYKTGQTAWQVDNSEGRLVFSTTSVAAAFTADNFSAKSWVIVAGSYQLHQWMHLACVYDHQAKRVWFYVNGHRLNEVDYGTSSPLSIGHARIGNWDREDRYFRGTIDELAIFCRPLAADEVERMYKEGRP